MTQLTMRRSRLSGLDGIRALAAITVLSYHVALWSKFAFAGPLTPLAWLLKGGVAPFFVISGAVLYLPYARAIRDAERLPAWRSYALRRAVRILPAYWIALTVFADLPLASGVIGPNVARYYSLSQIYSSQELFSGLPVAWSLSVEVTFYALLPVLAWAAAGLARRLAARARRPGRTSVRAQLGVIGVAGLTSIVIRAALTGSLTAPAQGRAVALTVALPGFLDWFAIGMALALLAAEWEAGRAAGRPLMALADRSGWCVLLGVVAFGVGVIAQHGDRLLPWYGLLTHLALGVGAGFLVLGAMGCRRQDRPGWWGRLLRTRCLMWLGTISYGIYLWQDVVLETISPGQQPRTLLDAAVLWLAVMAGSILLGAASWYLLERPLQRWLKARTGAKAPVDPAPAAAS